MPISSIDINRWLREYFGFHAFRPGQKELIETILAGKDALGVLPTGGGKSLTYQLPAVLLSGLTVVVSPLIALINDQVDAVKPSGAIGAGPAP
jgi:ATP-dependent DNA helicase RecQ